MTNKNNTIDSIEEIEAEVKTPAVRMSMNLAVGDSLNAYLREIAHFPLLQPEEELSLARQFRDHGDEKAAFQLISSHLRLVVKIAMSFQRRWMQNTLDLIQEGNIGLIKALQKFDPEKGIKFSYYSAFWVKAYILKYIMDNWRLVKLGTTQAQRKLFYNLNKERQRLQTLGFDTSSEVLSENLNVSLQDIDEMDQRLAAGDASLNVPIHDDTDSSRMEMLPSLSPGIEKQLAENEISQILLENLKKYEPMLSDKEKMILQERLLSDSPMTLRDIGEKYNITRERVRQIEQRLLEKLRGYLTKNIKDFSVDWIENNENE